MSKSELIKLTLIGYKFYVRKLYPVLLSFSLLLFAEAEHTVLPLLPIRVSEREPFSTSGAGGFTLSGLFV